MKEVDYESLMYKLLGKVQKMTGDTKIIKDFSHEIINYFMLEFYTEDYDMNNFDNDICNIANGLIEKNKYKKLHKLTNDELELVVSVCANSLEEMITVIEENDDEEA